MDLSALTARLKSCPSRFNTCDLSSNYDRSNPYKVRVSIFGIVTTVLGSPDRQIESHVKQTQARETVFFQQVLVNVLLV
jgi:hypothetical protein